MKTKQKLIDAYRLLDSETFQVNAETSCGVCERDYRNAVLSAPAVDAVEVVRCKDCIHYYEREPICLKIYSDGNISSDAWQERRPDDFCSYGKRKD